MSGGHFPYPKHVWAPTGGWWFTPKNANSNFLIIGSIAALVSFTVFKFGQRNTTIPELEYESKVIDSWNAAAKKGLKE